MSNTPLFYIGFIILALGTVVCLVTMVNFATPDKNKMNTKGIYKVSRNPMYVGYFLYFLGCVLLTRSLILLTIVVVFQLSAHWIILSEERWCLTEFGKAYAKYMKKVRRYLQK